MNTVTDAFVEMRPEGASGPLAAAAATRRVCARSRTTTRRSPIARSSSACSGRTCGNCWTNCAASGAPAARRGCCSKCWATSGSSSAIRICRTTCSTIRSGRRCWSTRCAIGCARSRSARRRTQAPRTATARASERDAKVARLIAAADARRRPLRRVVRRDRGIAQAGAARARAPHRQGQHRVRRPRARVARDRRHRLARRVSVRRAVSRHRRRKCAGWSRAASSSASRSFRAAAAPATRAARFRSIARSAVINTEKLERLSAVERIVLPGHTQTGADDRRRRRRGHAGA